MAELKHETLHATLCGVALDHCTQFRGIQYGVVPSRFAKPELFVNKDATVDCRKWGPRCPQNKFDIGHLLRAPEGEEIFYDDDEDEFKCLNLDVTVPKGEGRKKGDLLPVLVWVHGGSQIVSFGNGASRVGDVSRMVDESMEHGRPVIVVSIQYRLNIFHIGDGQGSKNLGFKDQQVALEWVREHIVGFGGDPVSRFPLW